MNIVPAFNEELIKSPSYLIKHERPSVVNIRLKNHTQAARNTSTYPHSATMFSNQ
jgi:hypothetical protein